MPKNIEIKARIHDIGATRTRAAELATEPALRITQKDTFFFAGKERLKLRESDDEHAELIYYDRPDASEPKCSTYYLSSFKEADPIKELLGAHAGVIQSCGDGVSGLHLAVLVLHYKVGAVLRVAILRVFHVGVSSSLPAAATGKQGRQ